MSYLGSTAWAAGACVLFFCASFCACGYTEQEMAAKQREVDALTAQVKAQRPPTPACPPRTPLVAAPTKRTLAAR